MNPSEYIEKAVSALLEQDEKIKTLFYSHTYDDTPVEELHQTHHKIKQWAERLMDIRDEILADTIAVESGTQTEQTVFCIRRRDMNGIAKGIKTGNGFRVLRGSFISAYIAPNMYEVVKRLRHENTRNIDSNNRLTVDIDFDNAGQAARFVTGKQINGLEEWQTDEGVTLKQFVDSSHTSANAVLAENNNEQSVGDEFTNKKPISVILFGESHPVTYWRDVLICTCEVLYSKTPQIVCSFDKSGSLNKKRPTFSWRKEVVKQQPKQLSFGLWVELNQSAQTTVRICEKMLIECGFAPKDLKVIAKRYDLMALNPKY